MLIKKPLVFSLLASVLVILAFTSYPYFSTGKELEKEKIFVNDLGGTGSGGNFAKLTVNFDENKLPHSGHVYKIKKPKVNKDEVKRVASNLGVVGEVTEDETSIVVKVLQPPHNVQSLLF